ncbi:hypothetical protein DYB37_006295 [Aphanomyces astaci]|uniref:Uncharacterized protein n=1 Tax=Aphanomyces astaci TaxID=112090 RepID=A0A3R7EXG3_APHAT|nr:hypothetical protein DYB35_006602 [Aphanomyces astaci]RHZ17870.1 hypothetical protein DYB37_006295 [Aphanomyces astaci]
MCAAHKKRQHQDSTWDKFRQVMSRFTANVEAVVAAFLLSSSSSAASSSDDLSHLAAAMPSQHIPRRVLIPTGRVALRVMHERRQACNFHSISDDVDSDQETEGSEDDAFSCTGWDDSAEWRDQWSALVTQSRFLDEYVKHVSAQTIQRAMRKFLWSRQQHTIAAHLFRVRTPLKCLFRLHQEIDLKHRAAGVLQHAWRHRPSGSKPNRLKRKRTDDHNLKPSDVCRQGALLAHAAFHNQDTKDMLVQALLC